MAIYILMALLVAYIYVDMGMHIADAFDESSNTLYIIAWPAMVIWLMTVLVEDYTERITMKRYVYEY